MPQSKKGDDNMNDNNNSQAPNTKKDLRQRTWLIIPAAVALWWVRQLMRFNLPCILLLAAVCYAISVLFKYEEQAQAMQRKRLLLLAIDIPICVALFYLRGIFAHSGALYTFFWIICPSALLIVNIMVYLKNACDKKMFIALLLSDPLFHYMAEPVPILILYGLHWLLGK